MQMNLYILASQLLIFISTIFAIIKGVNWMMVQIDKRIDEKINLNPYLQDYKLIQYKINQLEPDIKQIKIDIQNIKLALARKERDEL